MTELKGEKLKSENETKKVFHYFDAENKIDRISSEIYKKQDKIVHYPRGFDNEYKYKTIRKFTYIGFKGKLPVGVVKAYSFGYGFTKTLNPFSYHIDDNYKFEEVIIEKNGKVGIDLKGKKLYLNEVSLDRLNSVFRSIYKQHKSEIQAILMDELYRLFPKTSPKPKKAYIANTLATSLNSWGHSINEFSDTDKTAIKELFDKLSLTTDFLSKESLAKTKEIVDVKYIQETLKGFKGLMELKTDGESLEKQWQLFLRDHSWIFSSIFAQPVILHQREAFVGGKAIDNTGGKFNDFLIKNSLSDNVAFIEIKTHKTKLLENTAYRGDDVFSASKDLTGCIAQVLNQRDNFQKEFYALKAKSREKGNLETFNSKCVIIIGSMYELDDKQRYSLELFRSNSRDVEIITFDELQTKIEGLQTIMTK